MKSLILAAISVVMFSQTSVADSIEYCYSGSTSDLQSVKLKITPDYNITGLNLHIQKQDVWYGQSLSYVTPRPSDGSIPTAALPDFRNEIKFKIGTEASSPEVVSIKEEGSKVRLKILSRSFRLKGCADLIEVTGEEETDVSCSTGFLELPLVFNREIELNKQEPCPSGFLRELYK